MTTVNSGPQTDTDRSAVLNAPRSSVIASLVDGWHRFRDRLLANPRFQRWAAGFPLTRWFAQKRAMQLFDLCAGFVYSQILIACVRLDLFERLSAGPKTVADLAPELRLTPERTRRLLDAAVSLRLLQRRGAHAYGLGLLGAALRGNPGVARMIEHHPMLYRDLSDPVELLRGESRSNELSDFWAYSTSDAPSALDAAQVEPYSALMAESQQFIAGDVLDAFSLEGFSRLLDVGGGQGAFLIEAGLRHAELELELFDLPSVAARATHCLERAGLSHRARALGGDVFADALPQGADIVSLVRVIHDHDDDAALRILRAAYRALSSGGRVMIAEPMAGTPGALAMGDAYFGFYLLAMGHGQPRTPQRLQELVEQSGFRGFRRIATRRPMLTQLVVAERR